MFSDESDSKLCGSLISYCLLTNGSAKADKGLKGIVLPSSGHQLISKSVSEKSSASVKEAQPESFDAIYEGGVAHPEGAGRSGLVASRLPQCGEHSLFDAIFDVPCEIKPLPAAPVCRRLGCR